MEWIDYSWLFYVLLPIVAFLYASIGHGGASGYLALMALFGIPSAMMRPSALLLNLFVAAVSFFLFYKKGYFKWKLFYPFAILSIPASFVGGYISLPDNTYKIVLGVLLLFVVFRIAVFVPKESTQYRIPSLWQSLSVGAGIGFISGLIGIGGGIILSPIILLMRWADVKTTAAVSALFIWVNSAAGLGGLWKNGATFDSSLYYWVALAILGGLAGGYFGSKICNKLWLTRLLALVICIACFKLLAV